MSAARETQRAPGKFRQDVVWNFASLAVLGLSGFALTSLISRHYDESALGVFNQVLATYTIFSMLAAGGLNHSALRAVAEHAGDRRAVTSVVVGALLPALALSAATALVYFGARGAVAGLLDSPATAAGIRASTPGLFFFGINKVLLGVVNGAQRMRAFAVYQALRYLLILVGLIGFVVLDERREHGAELGFVFTFAEALLFLPLAVEVFLQTTRPLDRAWRAWSARHLRYGVRSFASGILLEVHAKVDMWMIGLFLADGDVGVYTYASLVAEGVYQLLVVLQNVYNPILARMIAAGELEALHAMIARGRRRTYLAMGGVAALAIALFPTVVRVLAAEKAAAYLPAWPSFALLMGGIFLASGYVPFGQTLLMAGRPAWHTLYMSAAVVLDVALNAWMIPAGGLGWGLEGAAASTAVSMSAGVFLLRALVRREVGLRL